MKPETQDCVAMKHAIQRALAEQNRDTSWNERNRLIRKALAKDPHLRRLLELDAATK